MNHNSPPFETAVEPAPAAVSPPALPRMSVLRPRVWLLLAGLALIFGGYATVHEIHAHHSWAAAVSLAVGILACVGAVGYVRNVTARVIRTQAEAAGKTAELAHLNEQLQQELQARITIELSLRQNDERFRSIMESANDAIVLADENGTIISWNKSAERIFGHTEAEAQMLNVRDLMPRRHREAHAARMTRFHQTGEKRVVGQAVEMVGLRKDGTEFPVELSLSLWKQGTRTFFSNFMRDITSRKETEAAMRAAEERYRGIFENAIEGIYQSTPDGHYLNVNPALARMYGYNSPAELIGGVNSIGDQIYVDPDVRRQFRQQVEETGEVRALEYQVRRRDGSIIWISEFARAVRHNDGSIQFYEGTITDISRRKQVEADKKRLEAQIRQSQKMEAIGTLAGGIAHDFNNILGAITGFTEMSLDDVQPNSLARSNLQQVMKAAHRARDLIRQIMAFSRQGEASRKTVQLAPLIRETLKLIRAALPTTIHISHEFHAPIDTVVADATQLHQVMMNLCTNAGHAMKANGGTLHLQLETVIMDAGDTPEMIGPGVFLRLSVSDTGHGISRELMDRIFEPFFTTKSVGEGTGLGLAVVHGIVTTLGGWITVESELGKGTTFNVFLPRAEPLTEAAPEPAPVVLEGRGRVLFVDDEEDLVNVLQQKLRRLGYKVTTKSDSVEALNAFKADPDAFDLVITDYTMPRMTGIELGRAIKQIRPDIALILSTGYSLGITPGEMEQIGFSGLILKPVDFQQLGGMLRTAIEKNQALMAVNQS